MGETKVQELALLDQAGQALAEAQSFEEIKIIRDKAEAVRNYARSASLGLDVQNRAAEVKLRAERQAGKLLAQLALRGGDRRSKSHHDRMKLDDLGITANQSKRWQTQARVPESVFREHIRQTCGAGKELTSAGVMRLAKRLDGESPVSNGHADRKNGYAGNGHYSNGHGHASTDRFGKLEDPAPATPMGELVSELRNHHSVLDGILRPLYTGETAALRPAELRMLRYLMAETGQLLAQVDKLDAAAAQCLCHQTRARA